MKPLPSTLEPFDWDVMPSGTKRYWDLAWALLARQVARLAVDGIVPRDDHRVELGTFWTPAVDLELGDPSTSVLSYLKRFVPERDVLRVASAGSRVRLPAGSQLRLLDCVPDIYYEGMGVNVWSIDDAGLGVPFLHSALEGRWGGAALLADHLIVPRDHPIAGDDDRADRLVRDLQAIIRTFREANGLPAEGRSPTVP